VELKPRNLSTKNGSGSPFNPTNSGIETEIARRVRKGIDKPLIRPIVELKLIKNDRYGYMERPFNPTNSGIETIKLDYFFRG